MRNRNRELLITAARLLKPLLDELVFVGGCATGVLITDPAAADVRETYDVDVIVEIGSRMEYYDFAHRLRALGFSEDSSQGAPLCRWKHGNLKLDVMPTDGRILGLPSRWFKIAMENPEVINLEKDLPIPIIKAPYFVATKLDAFKDRGKNDYFESHDLEDLITVIDGRPTLLRELQESSEELQEYISSEIGKLLRKSRFMEDALPGHLLPDSTSQERIGKLRLTLMEISNLSVSRKSEMKGGKGRKHERLLRARGWLMKPNPKLMAFISQLLPPMTGAVSLFIPGRDSRIAWQNARNNADIIQLVARVSAVLPSLAAQAGQSEKRKNTRVPLDASVELIFGGERFEAQMEDISVSGLQVRSDTTLAQDSEIALAITPRGASQPIHAKGRVVRVAGGKMGVELGKPLFDPFEALWAIEGLGHTYADSFYERNEEPRGLLIGANAEGLPDKSMTMLHAGIGMSFAKRSLEKLARKSPASEIRKTVETVVELCRNSSQPGYAGCAIESLGLAARFLHGAKMVRAIDEQLAPMGEELVGYLWHGAGRAMYFSPRNVMPGWRTPWRAVKMCRSESPHELGRRSAGAGFAWAITLVNMRSPLIMETLLQRHEEELQQDDAFSNGVMSSLIMRYDIIPDDATLTAFRQHRPGGADKRLAELWERLVRAPAELALSRYYPVLKERRRLEEVFRYQDLAALVEKLVRSKEKVSRG